MVTQMVFSMASEMEPLTVFLKVNQKESSKATATESLKEI